MGILLTLAVIAVTPVGNCGFSAAIGFEPSLLGWPVESFINPYGNYYLNDRGTLKAGISFNDAWSVRGVFGAAGSYYPQGRAVIDIPGYVQSFGFTKMKSFELSAGPEVARSLRLRAGKGEFVAGLEGVWGRFDYSSLYCLTEDYSDFDYRTVSYSCNGAGIQGYAGVNYPLARLNHFTLNLETALKAGGIFLSPYEMPEEYVWTGYYNYISSAMLPRWGVSVGLSLAYDSREIIDTSRLFDARLKPNPARSACCCLFAARNENGGIPYTGGTAVAGKLLQGVSAVVLGPALGTGFGLFAAMMNDLGHYGGEAQRLACGTYLWTPVGSVLGTMWSGRFFNPGGDWKLTILGACLGNLANLIVTEGFFLANGGSPYIYSPDGDPFKTRLVPGTYEVIAASSLLPAAGAIIGYNLSIGRALGSPPDTVGCIPSWTEFALEQSRKTGLEKSEAPIALNIIDLAF
jgi:hypothetical protein